jgi:uncharacterized MAPEG superfamily protein
LPTEIAVLGLSVVLLLVHVFAQGQSATRDTGLDYNAGPRDEEKPKSVLTGRLDRAKWNFLETYPAFVALALALAVLNQTGGWAAWGAVLWLAARIVYLPLYAFGVPVIRSMTWALSIIGLLVMLGQLLF